MNTEQHKYNLVQQQINHLLGNKKPNVDINLLARDAKASDERLAKHIEAIEKKLEIIADSFDRRMDVLEGDIIELEKKARVQEDAIHGTIAFFSKELGLPCVIFDDETHEIVYQDIPEKITAQNQPTADQRLAAYAQSECADRISDALIARMKKSRKEFKAAVEETHKAMCAIVPDWDLPQDDLEKQYVAAHKRFLQLKAELDMRSVRPMIEQLKADAFEAELSE